MKKIALIFTLVLQHFPHLLSDFGQVELLSKTCLCSRSVCVCKEVFLDSLAEQQSDVFRGDISSLCGYKFYAFSFYTPNLNLNPFSLPFLTRETLSWYVFYFFLRPVFLVYLPYINDLGRMFLFVLDLI